MFTGNLDVIVDTLIAALFAWLGLYLIRRDVRDRALVLAGTGGLSYAAAIAADALGMAEAVGFGLALAAAGLWFGAVAAQSEAIGEAWRSGPRPRAVGLIGVGALFLALSAGGLILRLGFLPRETALLLVGIDGLLLAVGIAAFDAFAQGESLRRDMLLSGTRSGLMGAAFGGQAAALGAPFAATLTLTLSAVLAPLLAAPAQAWLDKLVFAREPALQKARADLRGAADALPRASTHGLGLAEIDEAEFAKLTRRALSALNDLTKLSASALLHLPQIDATLRAHGASDNVLERAAILRVLLAESVERLKPRGQGAFGTTDGWRHYNALYWPYIAGLKPYSARGTDAYTATEREALAWFQTQVPERTLHNWQSAAAKLVAMDLRARGAAEQEQ